MAPSSTDDKAAGGDETTKNSAVNKKRSSGEASTVSNTNNNANKRAKRSTSSSPTSSTSSSSNNVRVVARLRPLSSKEVNESSREAIHVVPTIAATTGTTLRIDSTFGGRSATTNNSPKTFEYDGVFGPNTAQEDLYQHTIGDMVRTNIYKGYNLTGMAYGQTGSGKTYSMGTEGGAAVVDTEEEPTDASGTIPPPAPSDGIIPRAVYDLFDQRQSMPNGPERVTVELSYLEIYNEEARDLLAPGLSDATAVVPLQIRDSRENGGGVVVQNLSKKVVTSPKDVATLMNQAANQRATASTAMNAVSSRSHAICTLYVTIAPPTTSNNTSAEVLEDDAEDGADGKADDSAKDDDALQLAVIKAKLTLVDLAGSERIKRTGAEGKRLKEGININKGLFVLGQCVSALSELGQQGKSASSAFIPYRDSKLTRLLQDSLGGNSKTVMVACISPADSNVDESINTLRYASRTRNIQNAAVRNVVATGLSVAEASALRQENQRLQEQLTLAQAQVAKHKQQQEQQQIMSESTSNSCVTSKATRPKGLSIVTTDLEPPPASNNCSLSAQTMLQQLQQASKYESTIASLETKIELLEEEQQSWANESLSANTRADKWQMRYEQLAKVAQEQGVTVPSLDSTATLKYTNDDDTTEDDDDNSDANNTSETLVVRLRKQIETLKQDLREALADANLARATAAAIIAGNGDLSSITADQLADNNKDTTDDDDNDSNVDIATRDAEKEAQQAMTAELLAMSGSIEKKEAMALQLCKERETMRSLFENAVKSLQEELETLSAEKDQLIMQVKETESRKKPSSKKKDGPSSNNNEDAKRMKTRVTELETRIKALRQKEAEHKKSLKLREVAEKKIEDLNKQITADKKRRADLQKHLKNQQKENRAQQLQGMSS